MEHAFHIIDEPSDASVGLLVRNLQSDSANKGLSPRTYAHRARVIRQQREALRLKVASDTGEKGKQLAKAMRKTSRAPDHREEGGQG
ncbi:hypothetical protein GCM10023264_12060 [Sphingomonas daechungensis]